MGWVNPENPVKPTQKIQKSGLGMVLKNVKPIKNPINVLTR